MSEVTSDDVIGHGLEAAKLALEYIAALVPQGRDATEDEQRAVVVSMAACIAAINTRLLRNCSQEVYKESQDMILRLMQSSAGVISDAIDEAQQGEE